jgi:GNAT superfamily N-acetyltransferase
MWVIRIRQATTDDIESLFQLWKEMQLPHSDYHPQYYPLADEATVEEKIKTRLLSMIQDDEYHFVVAVETDNIDGQCVATTAVKPPIFEPVVQLQILQAVVGKEHRRRGVFRRLLEAVTAWGVEKGASEIELVVDSLNPAVRAYEACGFEIVHYKMVRQI